MARLHHDPLVHIVTVELIDGLIRATCSTCDAGLETTSATDATSFSLLHPIEAACDARPGAVPLVTIEDPPGQHEGDEERYDLVCDICDHLGAADSLDEAREIADAHNKAHFDERRS